jgi:hypothetical protein
MATLTKNDDSKYRRCSRRGTFELKAYSGSNASNMLSGSKPADMQCLRSRTAETYSPDAKRKTAIVANKTTVVAITFSVHQFRNAGRVRSEQSPLLA